MKKNMSIMLSILCILLLGGCGTSNYAKAEDIKMTSAYWTREGEIFGIDYTDAKGGVLLSNTSDKNAKVKVTAKFYDENQNYIDDESKDLTLKAKESWFVFFDIEDDLADVKYSVETEDAFWEPASASDIELAYENENIVVLNNSDKDTEACALQFVFYDSNDNILYVDSVNVNDGYVPAKEKVTEPYSLEYPTYLEQYEDFDINIYCLFAK